MYSFSNKRDRTQLAVGVSKPYTYILGVEKHVFKGSKIAVIGEWTTGSYKNKDGNTVYTNDCNISKLEFCDSKNSSGSSAEPQPKPDDSFMSIPDGIDEELPFN